MNNLAAYCAYLKKEEKSMATISQYEYAVRQFLRFAGEQDLCKEMVISFKNDLLQKYKCSSVNAKLAALNGYLSFIGRGELRIRQIRVQRNTFISRERLLTKKEYSRLLKAARIRKKGRLALLMQTICATGIRVSELKYITVEAVMEQEAVIRLKGKTRVILIPADLCRRLLKYVDRNHITGGEIFLSRTRQSLSRTSIWRMMKKLCEAAGIQSSKVFPHSLRHLFARTFYEAGKDISRLADVLGHSNVNTTRIYIASAGQEHRRMIDSLGLII